MGKHFSSKGLLCNRCPVTNMLGSIVLTAPLWLDRFGAVACSVISLSLLQRFLDLVFRCVCTQTSMLLCNHRIHSSHEWNSLIRTPQNNDVALFSTLVIRTTNQDMSRGHPGVEKLLCTHYENHTPIKCLNRTSHVFTSSLPFTHSIHPPTYM